MQGVQNSQSGNEAIYDNEQKTDRNNHLAAITGRPKRYQKNNRITFNS